MKSHTYRSFIDFVEKYNIKVLDQNSLIISDIDGVFFKGIFDIREIIGIISKDNLESLRKLLETKASFWIFTNRWNVFRFFPLIKQISKTIKEYSSSTPPIYSDCSQFLNNRLEKYIILMNSKKPADSSYQVVERGLQKYAEVLYIAAQDTPFYSTDRQVIRKLKDKHIDTQNLTYIDIKR